MAKQPIIVFTVADEKNLPMAQMLERSFKYFHKDIPFVIITGVELQTHLKVDPNFFYRQKPIIGEDLLEDYELVIGIDADSLILGDISHIWETKDYDIGTVLNFNRADAQQFGVIGGWGIEPGEYYNAGFVAMRSKEFVHQWRVNCFTPQWERLQFKEQDVLNAIIYFGNWNVRCFDALSGLPGQPMAWHGLVGKADWYRAVIDGPNIVVKREEAHPFPAQDTLVKVAHLGGGPQKQQWGQFFSPEIMKRIKEITS